MVWITGGVRVGLIVGLPSCTHEVIVSGPSSTGKTLPGIRRAVVLDASVESTDAYIWHQRFPLYLDSRGTVEC